MKLQVRCQLPFETKHSPNPGKTQPVPGIRTNKEELKGEWQRSGEGWGGGGGGEWRRRFYGPCWQYSISIKGPNSAFKLQPCPPLLAVYNHRLFGCVRVSCLGNRRRKDWLQVKICIYTIVFTHVDFLQQEFLLEKQYFSTQLHPWCHSPTPSTSSPTSEANFSM